MPLRVSLKEPCAFRAVSDARHPLCTTPSLSRRGGAGRTGGGPRLSKFVT